ncbi:MAG: hypothetical protein Q8R70_08360, partial [Methanoregula sp.]|nr:hypothetical protein [Methanoregula sp.]
MNCQLLSRKWRTMIVCALLALMLASPALGAVQWIRNGNYVIDDLTTEQAGDDSGSPAVPPDGVTISRIIIPVKEDYWLNLSPDQPGTIGNFEVMGTTNLPAGTNLSIGVYSTSFHPTPRHYDWSHEQASGQGKVFLSGKTPLFSGSINTSRLYPGNYYLTISTMDSEEEASVSEMIDMIPAIPTTPGRMNAINWSQLKIPTLYSFDSIRPEINGGWKIVERERVYKGDVSYGSVIYCAWDGICRVYDRDGIQ